MLESKEMIGAVDLSADRDMRIELEENLQPGCVWFKWCGVYGC